MDGKEFGEMVKKMARSTVTRGARHVLSGVGVWFVGESVSRATIVDDVTLNIVVEGVLGVVAFVAALLFSKLSDYRREDKAVDKAMEQLQAMRPKAPIPEMGPGATEQGSGPRQ